MVDPDGDLRIHSCVLFGLYGVHIPVGRVPWVVRRQHRQPPPTNTEQTRTALLSFGSSDFAKLSFIPPVR